MILVTKSCIECIHQGVPDNVSIGKSSTIQDIHKLLNGELLYFYVYSYENKLNQQILLPIMIFFSVEHKFSRIFYNRPFYK